MDEQNFFCRWAQGSPERRQEEGQTPFTTSKSWGRVPAWPHQPTHLFLKYLPTPYHVSGSAETPQQTDSALGTLLPSGFKSLLLVTPLCWQHGEMPMGLHFAFRGPEFKTLTLLISRGHCGQSLPLRQLLFLHMQREVNDTQG